MPPVQFCLHCQFLSHVLIALFLNQNSPKMKLLLQKNAKISSAWGSGPRPPCLRRGALPPNPIGLRRLDAPPPPTQPPNCEFVATRLRSTVVRFRTKVFQFDRTSSKMSSGM